MADITNSYKRTKIKLSLLEEKNIGWILEDALQEKGTIKDIIQKLKRKYAAILATLPSESKQLKIEEL